MSSRPTIGIKPTLQCWALQTHFMALHSITQQTILTSLALQWDHGTTITQLSVESYTRSGTRTNIDMNIGFRLAAGIFTILVLCGCLWLDTTPHARPLTGITSGEVVDSQDHPVAGATVRGIYSRRWTTIVPLEDQNAFIVATTTTGSNGMFTINTSKKVDYIDATTKWNRKTLYSIMQSGNVIRF